MDPAEVALLTLVAGTWPEVFDRQTGLAWHATLSYAVPLALDTSWQHWAWGNAAYLASTRQLVLVPASELVAVAPLPLRHDELRHRHRRLLRRHEATRSTAVTLDEVLRWWTHFAPLRHGTDGPPQDRAALATVMRTIGCTGQAWIHDGRAICMSVVCWHAKSRTVFDVLAPWDSAFARLRPGVYSAVSTMLQAAEQGWRYSLCYGTGAYKAEITAGTVPLTLPDLITE